MREFIAPIILLLFGYSSFVPLAYGEEQNAPRKVYDQNGVLRAEEIMENGRRTVTKFYDENGKFVFDMKNGENLPQTMEKMRIIALQGKPKEKKIIGEDWVLMSLDAKNAYVLRIMDTLKNYNTPLTKTPQEYIDLIDSKLMEDKSLLKAHTENILESVVYDNEPQARKAIDRIREARRLKSGQA